jgi:hypothetical protein
MSLSRRLLVGLATSVTSDGHFLGTVFEFFLDIAGYIHFYVCCVAVHQRHLAVLPPRAKPENGHFLNESLYMDATLYAV